MKAPLSWYPLEPGDKRIYRQEALEGDMAHPDFERWITEETVVRRQAVPDLQATLITQKTTVLSNRFSPDYLRANDWAAREKAESHILAYGDCLYVLDGLQAQSGNASCAPEGERCAPALDSANHLRPEYAAALRRDEIPADFCFPMRKGTDWGRVPSTSGAKEYVWFVSGLNADSFGAPGGRVFHLRSHLGSGTSIDRWFQHGVGVLQEIIEHHGTYDENRRQLLSATIGGVTTEYHLQPARIEPAGPGECGGRGWRHFARADGSRFENMADCVRYFRNRK
ncbi:MAG TPA: hypothetical protein VG345_06250, partial [Bryobacteraceae bacterium]|nr:hypothetical protein [Bryobacteraceae bacterium]